MITRRHFMTTTLLASASGLLGMQRSAFAANSAKRDWFMPDEGERHTRTWMAFGASAAIWGKKLLPETRRSLTTIAKTIAQFEPVTMLVRANEYDLARELVGDKVELVVAALDDLWMRDTGPTFVRTEQGEKAAVNFNFNGWGNKQAHAQDSKVAAFIAKQAGVEMISTKLVLEGGCFEVDGRGTAILTESCVLNNNRNPGVSKAQFEDTFMPLLGLDKIIWLPGIKGKDITDGHTDFYARFARPGVVVAGYDPDPDSFDHAVTQRHLEILKSATDAHGNKLQVLTLEGPESVRETYETQDFAAGYIGYYVCNSAVIMQEFGDKPADSRAKATLQQAFPDRKMVQINVDGIAAGGGSIHCTTQQEPA